MKFKRSLIILGLLILFHAGGYFVLSNVLAANVQVGILKTHNVTKPV